MQLRRMPPEEWERVRALRLRALRDAPDAFWNTLAQEEALSPEDWRGRLHTGATFIASRDGEDIGIATGAVFPDEDGAAGLFGMWVAPHMRGTGVAGLLVDEIIDWARAAGYRRLMLGVSDHNAAATRLYERKGFVPTGEVGALPPPRAHILEHVRTLVLEDGPGTDAD